ncbi:MAG: hypothetical protein JJU34_02565 [Lunatimonas sp.]|uniref:hypothetical protein n=1 Tax=Lunatimonas sp. TaxID=2060141 RepID=UPI00263B1488|nr:hypothetical protein [Lunatimonas sp.]MCC5936143.1 hypothetical protein [Lunatimonas sp.]
MKTSLNTDNVFFGPWYSRESPCQSTTGRRDAILHFIVIGLIAALCCVGNLPAGEFFDLTEQEAFRIPENVPAKMTLAEWVNLEKEENNKENELPFAKASLAGMRSTFSLYRAVDPFSNTTVTLGYKTRPLYILFHNLKIHLA